jgi:23S rRNA (cytidine1920-2'-O)/16S rRNA (cytidine1409-2'-O)-methyltransferase
VALVKPQFEVGKGKLGKGGVVKDEKEREKSLEAVKEAAKKEGL